MIGVVIVSHSKKIAEGIKELAGQMGKPEQVIIPVGGTETGELGTDPMAILAAIQKADDGDGVVVLADLGSAVMSVGMAKEMLDPLVSERVYLANAPIVEGAVAAVIEIAMGSSMDQVLHVAGQAQYMDKAI